MKKIVYYKCSYCWEKGDEPIITNHEDECIYNPKNKTCKSCENYYTGNYHDYNSDGCKITNEIFHFDIHSIKRNCKIWVERK